jgi:hypothetical protein
LLGAVTLPAGIVALVVVMLVVVALVVVMLVVVALVTVVFTAAAADAFVACVGVEVADGVGEAVGDVHPLNVTNSAHIISTHKDIFVKLYIFFNPPK